MRRSVVIGLYLVLGWGVLATLSGCGGGSQTTGPGQPAKIILAPSSVSMNRGQVAQLSSLVLDSAGTQILSATVTYASTNTSVVTVSTSGLLCAGVWDPNSNFTICNPGPTGTSNLTGVSGTLTSNVVQVTVHEHIDRIELQAVNPPAGSCVSGGATAPANAVQYVATASSNDPAACQRVGQPSAPCSLGDVGTYTWQVVDAVVASISGTQPTGQGDNRITVTALGPGRTNIVASISGVASVPSPFTTCSPVSIAAHVSSGSATSFTIQTAGTQQLSADVLDVNNLPIDSKVLAWNSNQPAAIPVSTTGLVTGSAPGTASIIASCTPPTCNVNVNHPVYSNVVTANVSGTTSTTVFVSTTSAPASGASNAIATITTSNNTLGTSITLPQNAALNSMALNGSSTQLLMGSNQGLIRGDPPTLTLSTITSNVTGKVLAVSQDGARAVVADTTLGQVFIYNIAASAIEATLVLSNATAAAFSPDNLKAYVVGNGTLFDYSPVTGRSSRALSSTGHDVSFLATGAAAYVATDAGDDVVATCNDSLLTTVAVGTPKLIAGVPNGAQVVDVNPPALDQIGVNANGACPPTINNSFNPATDSHTFPGVAAFVPRKLIVTPNSQKALILSDQGVLVYNIGTGTPSVLTLNGGALPLSGGVTLDSATLFVGASDNKVHRIDLTANGGTGADTVQIPVTFTPDLLVVKPTQTPSPVVTSIAIAPVSPIILVNQTVQFSATATFSDGSTKDVSSSVTWSSSSTTVATISTTGLATAKALGTTTISATSGGVTASTTLTVSQPITSIAVTPANQTLHVAQTLQFAAVATFSDGTSKDITSTAIWTSSVTSVATVSTSGLATAVAPGNTTIGATAGSVTGSTALTVIP